jgi:hypothetical protein
VTTPPTARHRTPGEADRDPLTRRASAVASWLLGPGLLAGGRLLLGCWAVLAVLVPLTRDVWSAAPRDAGGMPDHPLPGVFGPVALARVDDEVLTLPTVLGRRRVDLRTLRVRSVRLWVRGGNPWLHLLTDGRGGRVVLLHSLRGGTPAELREAVDDLAVEGRLPQAALLDLGWGVSRADRARVTVLGGVCVLLYGAVALATTTLLALPLLATGG